MDKDLLIREIFSDSGVGVGLSWKKNYLGKKGPMEEKLKVKALHIEINAIRHQQNFITLSNKYVILETGFPGVRNMPLLPVKNKTKSDHSNKKSIKAVLHQKYSLEVIQYDTNADIFTLYTNTGELDSFCMMMSNLTSTHYPNIALFMLV